MPLFPKDEETSQNGGPDAAQRMFWTREGGTRKLIIGFVGLALLWFVVDKIRDHFLLAQQWKPLAADVSGLSVVGALDMRGSYDRNMFRVVQASKEFRVELTDFGWRSIFDPKNGPLFTEQYGDAIKRARDTDDQLSNAMLEPYLRAGVARLMGKADWNRQIDPNMPILVAGNQPGQAIKKGTLQELIEQYSAKGDANKPGGNSSEGLGSQTSQDVEHGLTLNGDTVARVCPVVLTGPLFRSAELEEQPATMIGGRTWILHLGLTPEGRSRFYQWSHDHRNENLVFVLNHEVLAAGRVTGTLDVNEWGVGPLHDEGNAKKLEAYVLSHTK